MVPEPLQLNEIKLNPPKIRQIDDTLNYDVESFADKNDRTIGEVLRKMPGITVEENGTIIYNNKPINTFYIENRDLLQGRYRTATNNIEAKDVATVQVMENHQPIKVLKGREFTDEAAINLKLKNSAKGVLVANAQLGAGSSPALWDNELFTTYFNKNRQNMNTYKGNNTGTDNAIEFNSLYTNTPNDKSPGRLSVQSPKPPSISRKRYLFNREHAASSNNLWITGKDLQVTANVNYLNDTQEKSSYSRSSYLLHGDSILTIHETLASTEHINVLNGSFQLNANREKYYLDNTIKFTGQWNNEQGILLKPDSIFQNLNIPFFKMSNTFNLIRKYRRSSLKVDSYNEFSRAPQTLIIRPFLYAGLLDDGGAFSAMRQWAKQSDFSSVNKFSFGLRKGSFIQNYAVGFNTNLQRFYSVLQTEALTGNLIDAADSLNNNLRWNTYKWYFNPNYIYSHNRFYTTLNFPLVYHYLQTHRYTYETNSSSPPTQNTGNLLFNPSLVIRYKLSFFWNISASAQYSSSPGDIENGFTGYIMQTYRNLTRNDGQLQQQGKQSYNINLGYRHPIRALFFNTGGSHFRNKMNLLYGYNYLGILSLRETYNIINIGKGYTAYLRFSKDIDRLATTATFEANYGNSAASQFSQGQIVYFINEFGEIKPGFSTKLGKRASFSYSFQYMKSKNKIRNETSRFPSIQTYRQRAQLNFFPTKKLIINIGYENFDNNTILAENRSTNFTDIGIRLKFKKTEFSVGYTNIFNAHQYVSAFHTDISSFYSVYRIRPAQVLLKVRFRIK